jgi:RimJ/RimL family protein N-acetyltransferase
MVTPARMIADLGRVRIRTRVPGDILEEFHWRRDPELARLNASPPYTGSFSAFLEQDERQALYEGDTHASYALESGDGIHIGTMLYFNVDHASRTAEYGITIGTGSMLGRGFGTAVTVAFLRHVWATTTLRRIQLHVLEWNARAIRCFQKAGFEESARVLRGDTITLLRMEARREWWLLWDSEGRFSASEEIAGAPADSQ